MPDKIKTHNTDIWMKLSVIIPMISMVVIALFFLFGAKVLGEQNQSEIYNNKKDITKVSENVSQNTIKIKLHDVLIENNNKEIKSFQDKMYKDLENIKKSQAEIHTSFTEFKSIIETEFKNLNKTMEKMSP